MSEFLQKKSCYYIVTNDTYICVVGSSVNVYRKSDFSFVCSFTDLKNSSSAKFLDENSLVVKNTMGVFKKYDLRAKRCTTTIKLEKSEGAQDTKFVASKDNIHIYDLLGDQKKGYYMYKINTYTETFNKVFISDEIHLRTFLALDESEDILFFDTIAAGKINNELCSHDRILRVNFTDGTCTVTYDVLRPIADSVLLYFDNQFINKKMEVIDCSLNRIVNRINLNYQNEEHTYVSRVYLSQDKKYLYLIYSEKIVVIDYVNNKVIREYSDHYCSYAEVIGDKVLFGTWEKVVIEDL